MRLSIFIIYSIFFIASCHADSISTKPVSSYSATGGLLDTRSIILVFSLPDNQYAAKKLEFRDEKFVTSDINESRSPLSHLYSSLFEKAENDYADAIMSVSSNESGKEIEWRTGKIGPKDWEIFISMETPGYLSSRIRIGDSNYLKVDYSLINNIWLQSLDGKTRIIITALACGAVSCSTDIFAFNTNF